MFLPAAPHLAFESLQSYSVIKTDFFGSFDISMSANFKQKQQMENICAVRVKSEIKIF